MLMNRTMLSLTVVGVIGLPAAVLGGLRPTLAAVTVARGFDVGCGALSAGADGSGLVLVPRAGTPVSPRARLYARLYAADGSVGKSLAVSPPAEDPINAGVVALGTGDYLVYWQTGLYFEPGEVPRARYRLIDAAGRPRGPARTAAAIPGLGATAGAVADLRALAIGDAVAMSWKISGQPQMALRLDPYSGIAELPRPLRGGAPVRSVVEAIGPLRQAGSRPAGFVVAWEQVGAQGRRLLFARAFGQDLAPLGDARLVDALPGGVDDPFERVKVAGAGDRFLVAWSVITGPPDRLGFLPFATRHQLISASGQVLAQRRLTSTRMVAGSVDMDSDGRSVIAGAAGGLNVDALAVTLSPAGEAGETAVRLHDARADDQLCPHVAWAGENAWWASWVEVAPFNGGSDDRVRKLRLRRFVAE
jgi:hypothetical protein